jgi:competence protein ComEA
MLSLTGLFAANQVNTPSPSSDPTTQVQDQVAKININMASQTELESLPRIGPVTAQRIIEFRTDHQGFKTLEELMNVKGIGQKTFDRLKEKITL